LEQLKSLGDEVYVTGDADYAGRYVFTGYRTDTSLSFSEDATIPYEITEQLDGSSIDILTKVDTGNLLDWNAANYAGLTDSSEQEIEAIEVYRIRLAYNECSADANAAPTISYKAADGSDVTIDTTVVHSYEDPYTMAADPANAGKAYFVPETGEVLLGADKYNELMSVKDDVATIKNEGEIRVTYQKSDWKTADLRPEHYFYCRSNPNSAEEIEYNKVFLDGEVEKQAIEYDVGFNQTIRVNSTADECFRHGIGREVDDLVVAMQEVVDLEEVKAKIEKEMKVEGADTDKLQTQLDAVDKALTLSKDKCQKLFERGITSFQGYLDDVSLCITDCGTRSSKLDLISNRMQSQKTTFETLKSENEDADITEVAIKLSSAELTYEAALMATGKVMQTTLLNFI